MGYSVITPFESKEIQIRMFDFLLKNFRDVTKLTGEDHLQGMSNPTTDPSYPSKTEKIIIGFGYSGWASFERAYAFRLCCWMAQTEGKRIKFEGKEFPHIIYDGVEKMVLVPENLEFKKKNVDQIVVDNIGFYPLQDHQYFVSDVDSRNDKPINKAGDIIYSELKRLNELYKILRHNNTTT